MGARLKIEKMIYVGILTEENDDELLETQDIILLFSFSVNFLVSLLRGGNIIRNAADLVQDWRNRMAWSRQDSRQ